MRNPFLGQLAGILVALCVVLFATSKITHAEPDKDTVVQGNGRKSNRILLIGQASDGHPHATHEFMAAMNLLAGMLQGRPDLQTIVVKADESWQRGPELIDTVDGVVLYVSQGARWIHQSPARLESFNRLAARGGGLVVLHWGMGTKDPHYIAGFVKLFGGCHGGPDRKYKIVKVQTENGDAAHPILRGIAPFAVEDEFYYALKFPKQADVIKPILRVPIEGKSHTVAWSWQRPEGGRSFGFSGCHFHRNWQIEEYRRLVVQGILWSIDRPIPTHGSGVDVSERDLKLAAPQERK